MRNLKMNPDNLFQKQNYLEVPNFFTKEECEEMHSVYKKYCSDLHLKPVRINETTFNAYQMHTHVLFMEKLCLILPRVAEIVEDSILPTYALARFYVNGAYLTKHLDRPACEISLTVNLAQDKEWGISLQPKEIGSKSVEIIQKPGDALFYAGHDVRHWRTPYKGNEYCQVFFHYVRSRGRFSQHYFDRSNMSQLNRDKNLKGLKGL